MITIPQIKEYIKCPQFGDKDYGKWGALKLEQREAYRHLIDIIEDLEQENKRLNNIINELEGILKETIENSAVLPYVEMSKYLLKELQELKDSDKE